MEHEFETSAELTAFVRHLDVHGARRDRWPEAARVRFEALLAREARARALLREEEAFERLLSLAPMPDESRMAALEDRVVGHANGRSQMAAAGAVVAPFRPRRMAHGNSSATGRAGWKVASALAAALIAGIYLGAATPVVSAVETIADSVGLLADADRFSTALFDDIGPGSDEDLL